MNHRWTDIGSKFDDTASGCEEHERQCDHCGLIKITVHVPHGFPYRAWRTANGKRWEGDATPPCLKTSAEVAAL